MRIPDEHDAAMAKERRLKELKQELARLEDRMNYLEENIDALECEVGDD